MTSITHGEKRKDGQGNDSQGVSKRHKGARTFNFWVFYNQLKAAMEQHDYAKVDVIMAKDEAQRIQANVKDLKYYAQHSAVTIKECLEKIVQKEVIIDQLSDCMDHSYTMDLNADNEKLKTDKRRLQDALDDISQYCADLEARINDAEARVDDTKLAHAALQLCVGKLVSDKADLKTQLANETAASTAFALSIQQRLQQAQHEFAQVRDVRKSHLQEIERLRQEMTRLEKEREHQAFSMLTFKSAADKRDQELLASKRFAKGYQQEAERLQKEFAVREQQLRAAASIGSQEANLVRQDLAAAKAGAQRVIDQQQKALDSQAQEIKAIRVKLDQESSELQQALDKKILELESTKAAGALLEIKLGQCKEELAKEHKALCECEKELALATIKLDAIRPAITAWKDCKEGDWAVVSISLELRVNTGELFWIGQVKSFGYKTDPKTNFREEQLQVQWYDWDIKKRTYKLDNLGLMKRDCVLFYTDKLPADAAEKKLVEDHIKKHYASVASMTREIPRRGAVGVLDG